MDVEGCKDLVDVEIVGGSVDVSAPGNNHVVMSVCPWSGGSPLALFLSKRAYKVRAFEAAHKISGGTFCYLSQTPCGIVI